MSFLPSERFFVQVCNFYLPHPPIVNMLSCRLVLRLLFFCALSFGSGYLFLPCSPLYSPFVRLTRSASVAVCIHTGLQFALDSIIMFIVNNPSSGPGLPLCEQGTLSDTFRSYRQKHYRSPWINTPRIVKLDGVEKKKRKTAAGLVTTMSITDPTSKKEGRVPAHVFWSWVLTAVHVYSSVNVIIIGTVLLFGEKKFVICYLG